MRGKKSSFHSFFAFGLIFFSGKLLLNGFAEKIILELGSLLHLLQKALESYDRL